MTNPPLYTVKAADGTVLGQNLRIGAAKALVAYLQVEENRMGTTAVTIQVQS